MSFASVLSQIDAYNHAVIERETFGHLDAKPGTEHLGHALFALGCHGDIIVLEWEFEGVESNPWIYRELHDFVAEKVMKTDREWGVWLFEGIYKVHKNGTSKFVGKVRPCRVTTRFGRKRSF